MFERFSDGARRVVVLAQEGARELRHSYIGTEHILLGVVQNRGTTAETLASMGISPSAVRSQIEGIVGSGQAASPDHIPFSPHAKEVLAEALREAVEGGTSTVEPKHLLLGLISLGEGVGLQILRQIGPPLSELRDGVLSGMASGSPSTSESPASLMASSRSRWETLRCEGHEWRDDALLYEAFLAAMPNDGGESVMVRAERPGVEEGDRPWRLWIGRSSPPKIRTEFTSGSETTTAVIDGATWWRWSPTHGGITNDGDRHARHGLGPGYPLTDPASIASLLRFEVLGRAEVIGRSALRVRAIPKARPSLGSGIALSQGLNDLGWGADEYELVVDEERGTILRSEARLGGLPCLVLEMDEIAFDEPIEPERFTLTLPPGERFESSQAWHERLIRDHFPEDDPSDFE